MSRLLRPGRRPGDRSLGPTVSIPHLTLAMMMLSSAFSFPLPMLAFVDVTGVGDGRLRVAPRRPHARAAGHGQRRVEDVPHRRRPARCVRGRGAPVVVRARVLFLRSRNAMSCESGCETMVAGARPIVLYDAHATSATIAPTMTAAEEGRGDRCNIPSPRA